MKETFVDVMDAWLASRLRDVHTVLPGIIESYAGHTERKAKVKVQVKFRTKKGEELSVPPIDNVPVIFPSSNKFNLLFPLSKGDGCLIIFAEEGIGEFLAGTSEVSADSLARFSLTDAICIPGLFAFKQVPGSAPGTIEIDNDGNININNGTNGAARQNDATLHDAITDPAFWIWFSAVGTGSGAGPPPSSLTGKINAGSSKVKIG